MLEGDDDTTGASENQHEKKKRTKNMRDQENRGPQTSHNEKRGR
jgi:hypothetical protein